MNPHTTVRSLDDTVLIASLKRLNKMEHECLADVVLRLAEIDSRKLYVPLGYASLFAYCTKELQLSESSAGRKIAAARALARYPKAYELLRERKISLASLSRVSGVLTEENKDTLIPALIGASKQDVEMLIAAEGPQKKLPKEKVTPIVQKKAKTIKNAPLFEIASSQKKQAGDDHTQQSASPHQKESQAEQPTPQEKRFALSFSVSEELMDEFHEAQRLLSGKYPKGAGLEEVFKELLSTFLKKKSPKERAKRREAKQGIESKTAPTSEKTSLPAAPHKRYIPRKIYDAILQRDGQRCTYVGETGVRCSCTWDLEVDHRVPVAHGGSSDNENLRVLCRVHNLHEAKRIIGASVVESHIARESNLMFEESRPRGSV